MVMIYAHNLVVILSLCTSCNVKITMNMSDIESAKPTQ